MRVHLLVIVVVSVSRCKEYFVHLEMGRRGSEGGEDAERGGRVTVRVICKEKSSQMS